MVFHSEHIKTIIILCIVFINITVKTDCGECGTDVELAIWDDAALSGLYVVLCYECHKNRPEHSLWEIPHDVDEEDYSMVDIPKIPNENQDWVVIDHYEDFEPESDISVPMGEVFDIIVQDFDDKESIKEARTEVKKRLKKNSCET